MDNRTCWLGGLTVGYSGCVSGSKEGMCVDVVVDGNGNENEDMRERERERERKVC